MVSCFSRVDGSPQTHNLVRQRDPKDRFCLIRHVVCRCWSYLHCLLICEITAKFVVCWLYLFQLFIHKRILRSIHGGLLTEPYVIVTWQIPQWTFLEHPTTVLTEIGFHSRFPIAYCVLNKTANVLSKNWVVKNRWLQTSLINFHQKTRWHTDFVEVSDCGLASVGVAIRFVGPHSDALQHSRVVQIFCIVSCKVRTALLTLTFCCLSGNIQTIARRASWPLMPEDERWRSCSSKLLRCYSWFCWNIQHCEALFQSHRIRVQHHHLLRHGLGCWTWVRRRRNTWFHSMRCVHHSFAQGKPTASEECLRIVCHLL